MSLVFIHGSGFTGEVFANQTRVFAGSHAPNLPGHCTEGSAQSISEFAQFIEEYATAQALTDLVLCGHSMGGAVALEIALRRRIALRGIAMFGSGAKLRVSPAIFEDLERDFDGGSARLARYYFADATPERIAWAAGFMRRVGVGQTVRDFRACDAFDALDRLGELSVPVLALTGDADQMTPPKFTLALAGRVRNAQARIIADAGHFAMVEQPEETNAELESFLSGIA